MKSAITLSVAISVLSIAIMATSANAGQKTLPHWNSWPGTIWSATQDTGSGPVTCDIPRSSQDSDMVQMVAQSIQDCTDVGGTVSS